MNILRLATVTLSLTLLATCGGGGGGGAAAPTTTGLERVPNPLIQAGDVSRVTTLVGGVSSPPDGSSPPTPSDLEMRVIDIAGMSDALLFREIGTLGNLSASRMITCSPGESMCSAVIDMGSGPQEPEDQAPEDIDGPILFVGGEGLTGYNDQYSFVMIDGRIPLVQVQAAGRLNNNRFEYQGYGGWMDDSVFVIQRQEGTLMGQPGSFLSAYSFGNAEGTNPTGTSAAEWDGVMIGVNSSTNHIVQGDAEVEIRDFSSQSLVAFVEFTNIRNLNTGAIVTNMGWANLTLTNGNFSHQDSMTGSIEGTFYGQTHDEVGGIFDRNDIIGAFGAIKQ